MLINILGEQEVYQKIIKEMTIDQEENNRVIYIQLCTTYHRLKNFRASLLGLLPLGSGVSAFVTLKEIPQLASIIGCFGLFCTLG